MKDVKRRALARLKILLSLNCKNFQRYQDFKSRQGASFFVFHLHLALKLDF